LKLEIAILGLGSIGMRHATNIMALGHKVRGFDPAQSRQAILADAGGYCCNSLRESLEGASAAVIATPSGQHLSDLAAVVHSDCHAFIEKPLAHVEDGIEALLLAAEKKNLVVFAGLNQRFNPTVLKARDLIRDGELGTLLWSRLISSSYLPDWRPHQDYRTGYAADLETGGVIFDIIHEFDIANFLFGKATTVAAVSRNSGTLEISSEDCADIILRHDTGLNTNIHLDYVTRPRRRYAEVAGTRGSLNINLAQRSIELLDVDGNVKLEEFWHTTVDEDYRDEIRQFLNCIVGGGSPGCDGYEALEVLRQVFAARKLCGLPQA
jgi:predicted dehydrogenase